MTKQMGPGKLLAALAVFAALGFAGTNIDGTGLLAVKPKTTPAPTPTARPRAVVTARAVSVTDSPVTDYVRSQGYKINAYEYSGPVRCDYTLDSSTKATVAWTDGGKVYEVSGEANAMSRLYVALLGMEDWISCQYSVKNHARVGYGVAANDVTDSLAAYTARMKDTLDWKPTPTPPPPKIHYVLNKESRVFHYPDCWAGERIVRKKRQDVTTTREKVVAKGYTPCGICKP